jgi:D-alanyl-lipoteichoic acid acyltransferase DltB (MBOAT superfamily)
MMLVCCIPVLLLLLSIFLWIHLFCIDFVVVYVLLCFFCVLVLSLVGSIKSDDHEVYSG